MNTTRRNLFTTSLSRFGLLSWAAMMAQRNTPADELSGDADAQGAATERTHFRARAKRVIFLCMAGGPSHLDTFDYKPQLIADDGRPAPGVPAGGRRGTLLKSPFSFQQYGECGMWASELFSNVARSHADRLCLLQGMHTTLPAHSQASLQLHCGLFQFPRPSLGAWVLYGLGTDNENLPGFVTINPPRNNGGAANYGSSFLPAQYQGTKISSQGLAAGRGIENLSNRRRSGAAQRAQLDLTQTLNRGTAEALGGNSEIEGLMDSYELAFRMQNEVPQLFDISGESAATLKLYGINDSQAGGGGGRFAAGGAGRGGAAGPDQFGRQCLLARRLIESGVRFVEVTMGGWDHHFNLQESLERSAGAVDLPIAGLLTDLEQRGLLEDTLVLWGGEFGRTPYAQGDGRDHNNKGFTMWMAGAGVKAGHVHGATDEYGYEAISGRVHIHDWHATILHLLGLDHERLTYRYSGRDMRLTDVHGRVVDEILRG